MVIKLLSPRTTDLHINRINLNNNCNRLVSTITSKEENVDSYFHSYFDIVVFRIFGTVLITIFTLPVKFSLILLLFSSLTLTVYSIIFSSLSFCGQHVYNLENIFLSYRLLLVALFIFFGGFMPRFFFLLLSLLSS